jgi:WD40 repeat protein
MDELTAGSSTGKARQSNWESFDIKPSVEGTRKTHPTHQTYLAACLANTAVMASTSTQPIATADNLILTPVMTLKGHEPWSYPSPDGEQHEYKYISCICYFPDGKQMISGSGDKTIRRWDLRKGKEIEKDREVYEYVRAVGVSRDGRWVVIAGGNGIKVSEVETGIVRTFDEDLLTFCIDISADSTLLAVASHREVQIWNLDTGELVAGPFDIGSYIPRALRFSEDSRKLAVSSYDWKERHRYLEVWDVQTQKLDVQKSIRDHVVTYHPIFWTTKDKSIVTTFNSPDRKTTKISEFDASTLKTVGAPFKHTSRIHGLALSSDCGFLAISSYHTIQLWAFESRQLLASFNVADPRTFVFSPDSRQLAYTTEDDTKIRICNIPANILANIESVCISAYIHHLYANILTDQQI